MLTDAQLKEALEASPSPDRLTPDHIERVIADESYHRLRPTLTVCVLTLKNGTHITGESACADPANYNEDIGRKIARNNAKAKIWGLEGYLLRERLAYQGK